MVAEKDHGKRFTATFRAGVIYACAESCVVFNTGPYTDLPDNSILITANMQLETGSPSSHQLKSYVAYKTRLKLAARAVMSADAGLLVYEFKLTSTMTEVMFAYFNTLPNLHKHIQTTIILFIKNLSGNYKSLFTARAMLALQALY